MDMAATLRAWAAELFHPILQATAVWDGHEPFDHGVEPGLEPVLLHLLRQGTVVARGFENACHMCPVVLVSGMIL